jgi:hypothetical protein
MLGFHGFSSCDGATTLSITTINATLSMQTVIMLSVSMANGLQS